MLEPLLGTIERERVLMYLLARKKGYATEIARFFGTYNTAVINQLERLEAGGILRSHPYGRTRVYEFNPRYPLLDDLQNLLKKTLEYYSEDERERLTVYRARPRRKGKPIR